MSAYTKVLLEIRQNKAIQLMLSFLHQSKDHYYDRYQEKYLNSEFIDTVYHVKELIKEVRGLDLKEAGRLEYKFETMMEKIGMSLPETFNYNIEEVNIRNPKDNVCVLTNGTIFDDLDPERYFYASNNQFDSKQAARDFAKMLGDREANALFMSWSGKDKKSEIDKGAEKIFDNLTRRYMENIHFDLIGHSHGGNVMIQVANKLYLAGFIVDNVICLNTPAREYVLTSDETRLISVYTPKDKVMSFGNIDLYDALIKFRQSSNQDSIELSFKVPFPQGKKGYELKGAKKYDITNYISENELAVYQKMIQSNFAPYPYHQFTRIVSFVQRSWGAEGIKR